MSIRDTTKNLRRLRNRATQNPLAYFCPTPPQEAWLKDPSKIKLLLGGNQVGKTYAQTAELLYRCLGNHPYIDTAPPPIPMLSYYPLSSTEYNYPREALCNVSKGCSHPFL